MSHMNEKPLSVSEVASLWGVRIETVRRWIAVGKLGAFRLPGGEYRIPAEEIERIKVLGGRER
jgi:excisionase family DNA binding protein